jgi:hypothetical protein
VNFRDTERQKETCVHAYWTIHCSICRRQCASEITAAKWLDEQRALEILRNSGKWKVVKKRKQNKDNNDLSTS